MNSFTLGMVGPWQMIGLLLIALVIPFIAIIDILRHRFEGNEKLIWVLVVLFMPLMGTLLYLVFGRKNIIK